MSNNIRCEVCRFWRSGAVVSEETEFGYCPLIPPVPVKGLFGTYYEHPVTHREDFCSCFEENGEDSER